MYSIADIFLQYAPCRDIVQYVFLYIHKTVLVWVRALFNALIMN